MKLSTAKDLYNALGVAIQQSEEIGKDDVDLIGNVKKMADDALNDLDSAIDDAE